MPGAPMQTDDAVAVTGTEYAELPVLKLTWWQSAPVVSSGRRMSGALKIRTDSQFLARNAEGAYVRHVGDVKRSVER